MPVYDNVDRTTLGAVYEIDTFDNHNMPHRGTRLTASWTSSLGFLGADYEYDKAFLKYAKATTFAGRHTVLRVSPAASPSTRTPRTSTSSSSAAFAQALPASPTRS